jgi:iron complex outermembrane recepter protein
MAPSSYLMRRGWIAAVLAFFLTLGAGIPLARAQAAPVSRKTFNVAAGEAGAAIKEFALQASVEVMFPTEQMAGITTNAVKGDFTPHEALSWMLADTPFVVLEDPESGALAVKRAKDSPVPRPGAGEKGRGPLDRSARDEGETVKLEPVEVTGSHIKRLEGEGPQPVVSYAGTDIEAGGFQSFGDFMQSLPFNSGSMETTDLPSGVAGAPYARGATGINPRGLGAERFLVLVNGQRAITYGTPDSSGDSIFDFNSIPLGAIDSIEYLKDGASAIYGSDAITGVLNIKLKQSYSGLSTSLLVGDTWGQGADTFTRSANLLAGTTQGGTSIMIDATWFKQNDNVTQDYSRSPTTNYSNLGPIKGVNDNSLGNFPANVNLTAAQAAAAGLATGAGYYVVPGGIPTGNPTLAQFGFAGASGNVPNANLYDFGPTSQLTPRQDNLGVLGTFRHEFGDRLALYGQVMQSDNQTHFLYTPGSITSTSITTDSGSTLTIPANSPYNPFGVTLTDFRARALFGPPRTYDVEADSGSYGVGLDGKAAGDWTWTTHLNYGYSLVDQAANNQIVADTLQSALDGTLAGFAGSYLNLFGPSANPGLTHALFVTGKSSFEDSAVDYDLSGTGSLFPMPALLGLPSAGAAALAAGTEWRQEQATDDADPTNYTVNSGALPFRGGRTVFSQYVELDLPMLPKYLELQLAGRHDQYSNFGGTTDPKFALASQPLPFLKLRASYSESFKAPDLAQLLSPPTVTYSLNFTDPLRPQDGVQDHVPIQTGGNRDLQPETGKIWYEGAVVDADALVKGLSLSADYFNFTINHVIASFANTQTLFTYFPELVVRNPAAGSPGPIQYFNEIPINAAAYYWRGFDLGLAYRLPNTALGNFDLNVQGTRIMYIAYDGGTGLGPIDAAGLYNYPRWTGTAQLSWREGDLGASVAARYLGPYFNNSNAPFVWGENPLTLFNATVSYAGFGRSKLLLGCDNVLGQNPPPNGRASPSDGFDINTYAAWAMGRFFFVKVEKTF